MKPYRETRALIGRILPGGKSFPLGSTLGEARTELRWFWRFGRKTCNSTRQRQRAAAAINRFACICTRGAFSIRFHIIDSAFSSCNCHLLSPRAPAASHPELAQTPSRLPSSPTSKIWSSVDSISAARLHCGSAPAPGVNATAVSSTDERSRG